MGCGTHGDVLADLLREKYAVFIGRIPSRARHCLVPAVGCRVAFAVPMAEQIGFLSHWTFLFGASGRVVCVDNSGTTQHVSKDSTQPNATHTQWSHDCAFVPSAPGSIHVTSFFRVLHLYAFVHFPCYTSVILYTLFVPLK